MTDNTYNELENEIHRSSLSIFRENQDVNQFILTEDDHSVQPLEPSSRIVSISVEEGWFAIAANEFIKPGEYGPNEVELSAESIEEAVKLAKRAFAHDE